MKKLINGSDIRGIALSTDEYEANLTATEVEKIATGFLNFLIKNKQLEQKSLRIAIGYDSRITGPTLKRGLTKVFVEAGVTVLDANLATTPAMFMATQFPEINADAGIMITASHLPYFYNGLKFFTKAGGTDHSDIEKIIEYSDKSISSNLKGKIKEVPLISYYAKDMVEKIQEGTNSKLPLQDMRIVMDAGNGAGGFFAKDVLEKLGADTTGSQFLKPDGYFPNHIPNPDNPEAMASIQNAVIENNGNLGIIFDTDVDRAAVVDSDGTVINRNNLIGVLAQIVLKEEPGATIVTNSPTTPHLKKFIKKIGGTQYRYISGYRNVINKAIELNEEGISTPLAIETSGHAAFRENYFLDDGAYVIAKILMKISKLNKKNKKISDLIQELKQPEEVDELRLVIEAENNQKYGENIISELEKFVEHTDGFEVEVDNREGIRVNVSEKYGNGWFLLRMSLHEPLLVLQIENDQQDMNYLVIEKLKEFFIKYEDLNLSTIYAYFD